MPVLSPRRSSLPLQIGARIGGLATLWQMPATDHDGRWQFEPGCFAWCLEDRDTYVTTNHGTDGKPVLGFNGVNLRLFETHAGLGFIFTPRADKDGYQLVEDMKRGRITGVSPSFRFRHRDTVKDGDLRKITAVEKLHEISFAWTYQPAIRETKKFLTLWLTDPRTGKLAPWHMVVKRPVPRYESENTPNQRDFYRRAAALDLL